MLQRLKMLSLFQPSIIERLLGYLFNMNNYYIEEYTSDNKVYFNDVTVTINDIRQDIPFSVKSIALKELPTRNG